MALVFVEKRDAMRRPCSDPIWWRPANESRYQQGWFIERSPRSAVFLAREPHKLPHRATWLRVCTTDPEEAPCQEQEAFVIRIDRVYADISLVVTRWAPSTAQVPAGREMTRATD